MIQSFVLISWMQLGQMLRPLKVMTSLALPQKMQAGWYFLRDDIYILYPRKRRSKA